MGGCIVQFAQFLKAHVHNCHTAFFLFLYERMDRKKTMGAEEQQQTARLLYDKKSATQQKPK